MRHILLALVALALAGCANGLAHSGTVLVNQPDPERRDGDLSVVGHVSGHADVQAFLKMPTSPEPVPVTLRYAIDGEGTFALHSTMPFVVINVTGGATVTTPDGTDAGTEEVLAGKVAIYRDKVRGGLDASQADLDKGKKAPPPPPAPIPEKPIEPVTKLPPCPPVAFVAPAECCGPSCFVPVLVTK